TRVHHAAWWRRRCVPLATAAQLTTPPTQATTVNPPQINVVRVKPIDPAALASSKRRRNDAEEIVPKTILNCSSRFDVIAKRYRRYKRAPAIEPAEAIAPNIPM